MIGPIGCRLRLIFPSFFTTSGEVAFYANLGMLVCRCGWGSELADEVLCSSEGTTAAGAGSVEFACCKLSECCSS